LKLLFNLKFRKIATDFSWLHIYTPKPTRRIDNFGAKDKSYISAKVVVCCPCLLASEITFVLGAAKVPY
jgi:hypothetical protein